jgi:DNA-binding beta-propeller fold protein YncE
VSASTSVNAPSVAATPIDTSSLSVTWDAPAGVAQFAARYRVTATPGTFWGPRRTIEVNATNTSATIKGLESFKHYTIDVVALDANGDVITTGKGFAMMSPSATQQRYLYAVSLPYNRRGFRNVTSKIEVFDVNAGHRWVKDIPLPDGIYNARGVAVNAATDRLYVSFFNTSADTRQPGGLLCVDLNTDQVLWVYRYDAKLVPSPDRFALTPDGAKIYMPVGEGSAEATWWLAVDAATGEPTGTEIHHVSAPHNTIVSIDGRYAFLEGQEFGDQPAEVDRTIALVDTATDTVVRRIGKFRDVVRPFTITGDAKYLFATENNFVGFEVADIETGEVIFTVPVPGIVQPKPGSSPETDCHGIAITPDEKLLFLVDRVSGGVQVFDISGLRNGEAPRHIKFIPTRQYGRNLDGNLDPAAREDAADMPGWLAVSYDGRYVYPESGEVIDTKTLAVVDVIQGGGGLYLHSKFMAEVVFDNGRAIRVTDQFGVGRVR